MEGKGLGMNGREQGLGMNDLYYVSHLYPLFVGRETWTIFVVDK
jgi:hypothetical protein